MAGTSPKFPLPAMFDCPISKNDFTKDQLLSKTNLSQFCEKNNILFIETSYNQMETLGEFVDSIKQNTNEFQPNI
jgi:hypothetical protein